MSAFGVCTSQNGDSRQAALRCGQLENVHRAFGIMREIACYTFRACTHVHVHIADEEDDFQNLFAAEGAKDVFGDDPRLQKFRLCHRVV